MSSMHGRLAWLAAFGTSIGVCVWACGTDPETADGGADSTPDKKMPPEAGDADAGPFVGPAHLADTGLYSDFASRTLSPGVITYEPRYPLWSDGASKKRYLLLPPNTKIDDTSMNDWIFPIGTKAWKEFTAEGKVVETRLLWKIADSQWWEIAYAWTSDGTDAVAEADGGADALGTQHDIPSQLDCNACHANVRDVLIGVSAMQLGASDGDGTLWMLADAGLLMNAPNPPYDMPGSGIVKDALGYLHANCGHCHNPISAINKQTSMRLRVFTTDTTPEQTPTYTTATCLAMKHAIPPDGQIFTLVPGDPDASGIPVRMNQRGGFGMPPVLGCTKMVDEAGVATVRAWISSMDASACGDASTD